ncbi:galactokinase [Actinomadura sp. WAC 06369]|uniref:galactokinase n=1 Tax=Actinomadura sp. WAC 06369 TaxID=2203193 RepID=UPI000F7A7E02|nr:galactokinase [Actinomadura sp. WAC 06369]RSN71584.1 galactokinase [Actinomadura sp. WAC 06369]
MRGGVWSAPGRVNIIGEHTDYSGGFALPFALAQRTVVHARRRGDGRITAVSDGHGAVEFPAATVPGEVTGWGAHVAGVAWALARAGAAPGGADLRIESTVPRGAGLSSSHSLECAVALALTGLDGVEADRAELVRVVQRAENEYVGAPTGVMDQMASLYGADGRALLVDARHLTAEPVPCDFASGGLDLLVVDTRSPHRHADGEYGARRRTCAAAARALGVADLRDVTDLDGALARLTDPVAARRVRHVVRENARVLAAVESLRAGRVREIGPLLTASHVSLRDDYEVSAAELDTAVEAALAAGALGARMIGGGFGGSVIALVERAGRRAVESAVRDAFRRRGFTGPEFHVARPSRGAGRDG